MVKVSVIVPNYCHAPFLRERIDSILAQDYPYYEVILLDDASTDESSSILKEYSSHPKVKTLVINKQNTGNTFLQWMRGFSLATGDYIWIAESDDTASPSFLSRLTDILDKFPQIAMAFSASRWVDEEGHPIARRLDHIWRHDFSMDGEQFILRFLLGYNHVCNASAVLFRRSILQKTDMEAIVQYKASGDRLFWINIACQGDVYYIHDYLNSFRQHVHKVSNAAVLGGYNIVEDHSIYLHVRPNLHLSWWERVLISGYHYYASSVSKTSVEGSKRARMAWHAEREFCRLSMYFYLIHRFFCKYIIRT